MRVSFLLLVLLAAPSVGLANSNFKALEPDFMLPDDELLSWG